MSPRHAALFMFAASIALPGAVATALGGHDPGHQRVPVMVTPSRAHDSLLL